MADNGLTLVQRTNWMDAVDTARAAQTAGILQHEMELEIAANGPIADLRPWMTRAIQIDHALSATAAK